MEVETRVSVQAMKGRFEQLHEDTPVVSNSVLTTPRLNISPVSSRISGDIVDKETVNSCHKHENNRTQGRPITTTAKKGQSYGNLPIGSQEFVRDDQTPRSKSFLSVIVSPVLNGTKGLKTISSKKQIFLSSKETTDKTEECNETVSSTDTNVNLSRCEAPDSEGHETTLRPVKRIPVFRKTDAPPTSDLSYKSPEEDRGEEKVADALGKKGFFSGHTRSRSHGHFIIKKDSSGEKRNVEEEIDDSTGAVQSSAWRRQKSSDSLYSNRDPKTNFTFEGKQKLVANVVKNMKNKEKPKVLRKLSFSSKTEKELKNKKEKAFHPFQERKTSGLSSPDKTKSRVGKQRTKSETTISAKMGKMQKSALKDGRSPLLQNSSSVTGAAVAKVGIAKAVADIALAKSAFGSPENANMSSSSSNEDSSGSPPTRPPRRRSVAGGATPRKKNRAPSPPRNAMGSPVASRSTLHENPNKYQSSDEAANSPPLEKHLYAVVRKDRINNTAETEQLSESLERSKDASPILSNQSSPHIAEKRKSIISNSLSRGSSPGRSEAIICDKIEEKSSVNEPTFRKAVNKSPLNAQTPERSAEETGRYRANSSYLHEYGSVSRGVKSDASETEHLPVGPPPKKPPRTFAYDIYKNTRSPNHEESEPDATKDCNNINSSSEKAPENTKSKSPEPVYAIPMKKKKSENKINPKPPIRSNSDLTNRDLGKPTIAPKPSRIVNKTKRASMVDPLSSAEKDEEAAITSEFQRQAHIRYSLRRPKKPPPAPPAYSPTDNTEMIHDAVSSPNIPNASSTSQTRLNVSPKNLRHQCHYSSSPKSVGNSRSSHEELDGQRDSPADSSDLSGSPHSKSLLNCQGLLNQDYEDLRSPIGSLRETSHSSYNLRTSPTLEDGQPLSLGCCPTASTTDTLGAAYRKRSMSDETLYKGTLRRDEPIYATPIFSNNSSESCQRELHYMCSVLFTGEDGTDAGRDGGERRGRPGLDSSDGGKGRSSLISAWKREFRQSCRQVQNKIKKSVIK